MCYTQLILLLLALANNLLKLQPEEVNLVDHIHLQKELLHMAAANNHHGDKRFNVSCVINLVIHWPNAFIDLINHFKDQKPCKHLLAVPTLLKLLNCDQQIQMGDGSSLPIHTVAKTSFLSSFHSKNLVLNNLLHVPSVTKNLLIVSQFANDNSVCFEFYPSCCLVKDLDTMKILLVGGLIKRATTSSCTRFPRYFLECPLLICFPNAIAGFQLLPPVKARGPSRFGLVPVMEVRPLGFRRAWAHPSVWARPALSVGLLGRAITDRS
uniref:Retrovirus-related Pol polyprotein from transposon TNT 1-94-like beta-barrel domain-containing protein n=1 Tax=Cannabis sativa TaxID=3483 RepID=A0A803PS49_CANSA